MITLKLVIIGVILWHVLGNAAIVIMDVLYSSIPLLHAARFGGG